MNATTDRRRLFIGALTAGAAATVTAIPAVAAAKTPDPVFALREAHRAAWARFEEQDGSNHEAFTAAAGAVDAALEEITNTPPTTVAGLRAVIEYLVELDGHSDYLPTLLRSQDRRSQPLLAGERTRRGRLSVRPFRTSYTARAEVFIDPRQPINANPATPPTRAS